MVGDADEVDDSGAICRCVDSVAKLEPGGRAVVEERDEEEVVFWESGDRR